MGYGVSEVHTDRMSCIMSTGHAQQGTRGPERGAAGCAEGPIAAYKGNTGIIACTEDYGPHAH